MIELAGVSKVYRKAGAEVCALPRMDLSVGAGEFVAVTGPSGSGKTTLLLIAGGMVRPTEGDVRVDGRGIYALSTRERAAWRANTVGFVFQMFHLLPYLNVLENVLVPALAGRRVARQEALGLLDRFGLAGRLKHRTSELSIGERQRVGMARALLNRPALILADEPTGNLDPDSGAVVMDHLSQFNSQGGTVLLVTHETAALECADRTVSLLKR